MILTETWFRSSRDTENALTDFENAKGISFIKKNRRGRGGGVAIAFDKSLSNFTRVKIPKSQHEVVCAVGSVRGISKRVVVVSVYIPPRTTADGLSDLCVYISNVIESVMQKYNDPYICLGGDFNNKDFSPAVEDFPTIQQLSSVPSRNAAALDLCFANLYSECYKVYSSCPLESETSASDHNVVVYEFFLKKKHAFNKITRKVRKITKDGISEFGRFLATQDWKFMKHAENPTEMVEKFEHVILEKYCDIFPETTIITKDTDHPWITKRIKSLVRKKKRWYKRDGKSREWKDFERHVKNQVRNNQERHLDKVRKNIVGGCSGNYYKTLNLLTQDGNAKKWSPTELFPGKKTE